MNLFVQREFIHVIFSGVAAVFQDMFVASETLYTGWYFSLHSKGSRMILPATPGTRHEEVWETGKERSDEYGARVMKEVFRISKLGCNQCREWESADVYGIVTMAKVTDIFSSLLPKPGEGRMSPQGEAGKDRGRCASLLCFLC